MKSVRQILTILNTETKEADIRRDVHVIAPNVFAGAHTLPE